MVDLPLVSAVPHRRTGVSTVERKLLVRLHTDVGPGWGECAAMAEPLYSSEYVDGARHVLADPPAAPAAPRRDVSLDGVAERLAPVQGHRMAKAALEMAVLDAWGRARGRSLARLLGLDRARRCRPGSPSASPDSIAELLDAVGGYVGGGLRPGEAEDRAGLGRRAGAGGAGALRPAT